MGSNCSGLFALKIKMVPEGGSSKCLSREFWALTDNLLASFRIITRNVFNATFFRPNSCQSSLSSSIPKSRLAVKLWVLRSFLFDRFESI